ncbi:hypothetical protein H7F15_05460 [Pontibacter sp. Tf4]|uniref:ABC-three component system middle component 1 n=1 Tax=Pontibacter sp. Tf4 TaxID=2761620 RepID=UPI001623AD19|nr:ABC-three component system middle component 1 [Pontibacter sp. Tf4]MBB6610474.1 hypothetical protein [Pontibacter sp. Tf4]
MRALKLKSSHLEKVSETYPFYFLHWEVLWSESFKSHVVTVCMSDSGELEDNWEKINSSIPVFLDDELASEFERWNLYLLFFVYEPVSKHLKYKVENDKFSCRKIVVENFHTYDAPELENQIENIISNKIFNVDLKRLNNIDKSDGNHEKILPQKLAPIINLYNLDPRSDKSLDKISRQNAYKDLLAKYNYED